MSHDASVLTALTWSYSDAGSCSATSPCGPADWYQVEATCGTINTAQSPINIVSSSAVANYTLQAPQPNLNTIGCTEWKQYIDDDTSFTVDFHAAGCHNLTVAYKHLTYTLQKVKFHSPSEHTVGGSYYPAEMQLYHQIIIDNQLKTIATSIFLSEETGSSTSNNQFLDVAWSVIGGNVLDLPYTVASTSGHVLNPYTTLYPPRVQQFHYTGSFTTPTLKCLGDIDWFIYLDAVPISSSDLTYIRSAMSSYSGNILSTLGNNNRPTQSLNGRTVELLHGGIVPTASPTAVPTTWPTSTPTEELQLPHKPYYFSKTSTTEKALIIGSVALGLTGVLNIMVFIVIILFMIKFAKIRRTNEAEELMKQYENVASDPNVDNSFPRISSSNLGPGIKHDVDSTDDFRDNEPFFRSRSDDSRSRLFLENNPLHNSRPVSTPRASGRTPIRNDNRYNSTFDELDPTQSELDDQWEQSENPLALVELQSLMNNNSV